MDGVELVHEGVSELLGRETAGLSDDELAGLLVALHREQARLGAVTARYLSVFERRRAYLADGAKTAAAWLARQCHTSRTVAAMQVRLARRLRLMPVTAAALAAGEIDEQHARVLSRVADSPRSAVAAAFPSAEADLVGFAEDLSFAGFVQAVRRWEDAVDEDGAEDQAASDHAARRLHISQTFRGNHVLDGLFDVLGGTEIATAVRRIEHELFESDWANAREVHGDDTNVGHLPRTPAQRRADALVEMARRAMAVPRDARQPRPLISIVIGYETFVGRTCELFNRTVVTPGQVASLLTEADIERVVFDGPNRIIELGHRKRFFTGGLRRVLELRDRGCTHPTCDAPQDECQGDHVQAHARSGPTCQANGQLHCGFHNREKELTGSSGGRDP
jgi:Domain of unknown function (DUF222)